LQIVNRCALRSQILVQENDDRDVVPVSPIESLEGVVEYLLEISRSNDDVGKLAVRGVKREAKVALLLAGRESRARASPLPEEDDGASDLGHRSVAESLSHQGEAGARG